MIPSILRSQTLTIQSSAAVYMICEFSLFANQTLLIPSRCAFVIDTVLNCFSRSKTAIPVQKLPARISFPSPENLHPPHLKFV